MLIDDYDLVSAASDNPLVGIRDLLPQAKDIGLHVVLARRTAGASRGLYDPLIQTIRELGSPGFVGTGSRDEGALIGPARPDAAMPPGRGHLVTRRAGAQLVQMASDGSAVRSRGQVCPVFRDAGCLDPAKGRVSRGPQASYLGGGGIVWAGAGDFAEDQDSRTYRRERFDAWHSS